MGEFAGHRRFVYLRAVHTARRHSTNAGVNTRQCFTHYQSEGARQTLNIHRSHLSIFVHDGHLSEGDYIYRLTRFAGIYRIYIARSTAGIQK